MFRGCKTPITNHRAFSIIQQFTDPNLKKVKTCSMIRKVNNIQCAVCIFLYGEIDERGRICQWNKALIIYRIWNLNGSRRHLDWSSCRAKRKTTQRDAGTCAEVFARPGSRILLSRSPLPHPSHTHTHSIVIACWRRDLEQRRLPGKGLGEAGRVVRQTSLIWA